MRLGSTPSFSITEYCQVIILNLSFFISKVEIAPGALGSVKYFYSSEVCVSIPQNCISMTSEILLLCFSPKKLLYKYYWPKEDNWYVYLFYVFLKKSHGKSKKKK